MTKLEWQTFSADLSRVLLALDQREKLEHRRFAPKLQEKGYLGLEGATEGELLSTEQRLGVRLPPSYRTFLQVSNGWPALSWSAAPGALWSTDQINWARDQDPDLLFWGEDASSDYSPEEHRLYREDPVRYRAAYVANLLCISDHGDACDLLLSPEVVDERGEWECWLIANWYPGAARRQSFEQWMVEKYWHLQRKLSDAERS